VLLEEKSLSIPEAMESAGGLPLDQLPALLIRVQQAIQLPTCDPLWLMVAGLILWRLDRFEEAARTLQRWPQSEPPSSDLLVLKGMVMRRLPDLLPDAIQAFRAAIRIEPERADTYYNLANLLADQDRQLEAERSFQLSLSLNPKASLAWHNLGICFNNQQQFGKARDALQRSVELDPNSADAWCNLGLAYFGLEEFPEAQAQFAHAISLDQKHGASHVNMGNALINTLQPDDALRYLERGVDLERSSANSLWNLSLAYLLTGDYRRGWEYYEARFATENFEHCSRPTSGPQPVSLNECSRDPSRPLVVWSEQGIGDVIQFARYLLLLKAAGISFVFMTRPPLIRLMREWLDLPADAVFEQPEATVQDDQRQQIPLLSLPRLFRTELPTVPSVTPYLSAHQQIPKDMVIPPRPGGLSVGLVWATNPTNKAMYRSKSCPLALLMPRLVQLMDLDLIDLHALQVGEDREQLEPWKHHERLTDWGDHLPDFSATATVIQQLDLVISVDTAVAHLAGALHRPTWLLLPQNADFRWLRERTDSPWYPTMRLFRQPGVKDWPGLVAQVNDALDQLVMFDVSKLAEKVLG
tara:strand:- start:979 stop:2727 length:1749 start_codon:yes stop_codon:yes gene_type:complete